MMRYITTLLVLVAAGAARAEDDYSLSCDREVVSFERATAKRTSAPFVAKIRYTGKTTMRRFSRGDEAASRLDDLVLTIKNRQVSGGSFLGSTYDASTSYDGDFLQSGRGLTTWGYARDFNAFTLSHDKRTYVCRRR